MYQIRGSERSQSAMSNEDEGGKCLYGNDRIYRAHQSPPNNQEMDSSQDGGRGGGRMSSKNTLRVDAWEVLEGTRRADGGKAAPKKQL